jgi:starch phosphorylase
VGEGAAAIAATESVLNPNALTLGFARRFATYKRATLLFRDPARLARLLNNPERPVQVLFAGKAHPADQPGQDFIRQVYEYSRKPEFEGRVVFLEDYDMDMARHLVAGCDVWMNTPIRPHEASGTSGQKAGLNGLPNLSIIDGWWEEGYNGDNGWAIGERRDYQDEATRDEADATALYDILEREVVPLYFDRGLDGIPHNWVAVMKEAIRTVAPQFSMRRMIKEYVADMYVPALRLGTRMDANSYALAGELAQWKQTVQKSWEQVGVQVEGPREGQVAIGQPVKLAALVRLGDLRPDDVRVELVSGRDLDGTLQDVQVRPMERAAKAQDGVYRYTAELEPETSGSLVYGVRLVPYHSGLAHTYDIGWARWA